MLVEIDHMLGLGRYLFLWYMYWRFTNWFHIFMREQCYLDESFSLDWVCSSSFLIGGRGKPWTLLLETSRDVNWVIRFLVILTELIIFYNVVKPLVSLYLLNKRSENQHLYEVDKFLLILLWTYYWHHFVLTINNLPFSQSQKKKIL